MPNRTTRGDARTGAIDQVMLRVGGTQHDGVDVAPPAER